ncbi:hypothetical protein Tco_0653395 [Tanacetum coccineum]|uniref:Uncharacterized protein n=1 Tax=Tanacetum coccineum TaxID=301880 RepID=A0ABQ4X096_9ASTR
MIKYRFSRFYGANLEKAQKTMQFWSKNDKVYIMLERKDMTYSPLVIRRIKLLQYASLAAITSQLRSLGREMKNLSEQVHFVHVSYEHSNESHLSKDYPNKEQVKEVKEIYYGEFYQRPYPYSGRMSRHLEDLLKNKSRIDDEEKEKMNECCSVWLENTLPSKEKGLGSFTLPCIIGQYSFSNALADLGASEESIDITEIDMELFCNESPLCLQFKEFNYLLQVDEDFFTHEIVIQVENEEEILGVDIDIFSYESPICKQFNGKLEEVVSEDEEDEIEKEKALDDEIRHHEYEIEALKRIRRKEQVLSECKELVNGYESSSNNDTWYKEEYEEEEKEIYIRIEQSPLVLSPEGIEKSLGACSLVVLLPKGVEQSLVVLSPSLKYRF